MTTATMAVLGAFLEDPTAELYGLEICNKIGLAPGSVQPILIRFENITWLESSWEALDPSEAGRPRRRYYRLTRDGAQLAQNALARAAQRRRGRMSAPSRPGLAHGEA
jgi:PadR family transcriptional regulator, regulatory protein PadR